MNVPLSGLPEVATAAEPAPSDRRLAGRRSPASERGFVGARVRPGHDVMLIDVSSGGALLEAAHRLLPGTWVDLQLLTLDRRVAVRGRVLRSAVSSLASGRITYRGAVAFERALAPWPVPAPQASPALAAEPTAVAGAST
jgi:hypothetical protein